MTYKLSIIIPVYNVDEFLEKSLQSVLRQGLDDFELILIDDGPEKTSKICEEYSKKNKQIKLIKGPNKGVVAARNIGLKAATGDYITFVDADDWLDDNVLSKLLLEANKTQADIVITDSQTYCYNANDNIYSNYNELYSTNLISELNDRLNLINVTLFGAPWGKIYKSKLFKENNLQFLEEKNYHGFAEDFLFIIQALFYAKSVQHVSAGKYYYNRTNSNSICALPAKQERNDSDRIIILNKIFEFLHNNASAEASDIVFKYALEFMSWFSDKMLKTYIDNLTNNYSSYQKKSIYALYERKTGIRLNNIDVNSRQKLIAQSQTKVSVIIPIYNVEKEYLSNCLKSVLAQTLKEIEIILVIDGNGYEYEFCKKYAQQDSRIKIIKGFSLGLGGARNTGIEEALSQYIVFLDADDVLVPQACEIWYNKITASKADMVFARTKVVPEKFHNKVYDLEVYSKFIDKDSGFCFKDINKKDFFSYNICLAAWNRIYSTEFLLKNNIFFPTKCRFEDNLFYFETLLKAQKIVAISDCLYMYNCRENTLSSTIHLGKNSFDIIRILNRVKKLLIEQKINKSYLKNLQKYQISEYCYKYHDTPNEYKKEFLCLVKQTDKKLYKKLVSKYIFKEYSNIFERVFYIKNKGTRKILNICGLKIKFKPKYLQLLAKIQELRNIIECERNNSINEINELKQVCDKNNADLNNDLFALKVACSEQSNELLALNDHLTTLKNDFENSLNDLKNKNTDLEKSLEDIKKDFFYYMLLNMERFSNETLQYNPQVLFNQEKNFKIVCSCSSDATNIVPLVNLFGCDIYDFDSKNPYADCYLLWGTKYWQEQYLCTKFANLYKKYLFVIEDGFLKSIASPWDENAEAKYKNNLSYTINSVTAYFDSSAESGLEKLLNDENLVITDEQKQRARICIDKIVSNNLTKYNHQPIFTPQIGREGVKKILVIDQSYGDMAIAKANANDETFKNMLECAIKENPDADIIVKTHPDTILGHTKGYFTGLEQHDNVYPYTAAINPISLIQYCDEVYVCSSQMGFEALMCGKKVHSFGVGFYSGYGLTDDRQKCERRTVKRTLEEAFYIIYIMFSYYVNPDTQKRCEIEEIIDYIIEKRKFILDKQV